MTTALLIRLSDNVLDTDHFPVRRIEFSEGYIVSAEDIHKGVYSTNGFPDVGWHVNDLLDWLDFDSTGQHPEEYHEIKALNGERFQTVYSEGNFLDIVLGR